MKIQHVKSLILVITLTLPIVGIAIAEPGHIDIKSYKKLKKTAEDGSSLYTIKCDDGTKQKNVSWESLEKGWICPFEQPNIEKPVIKTASVFFLPDIWIEALVKRFYRAETPSAQQGKVATLQLMQVHPQTAQERLLVSIDGYQGYPLWFGKRYGDAVWVNNELQPSVLDIQFEVERTYKEASQNRRSHRIYSDLFGDANQPNFRKWIPSHNQWSNPRLINFPLSGSGVIKFRLILHDLDISVDSRIMHIWPNADRPFTLQFDLSDQLLDQVAQFLSDAELKP